MLEPLGISLFRNLSLNIFIYYLLTTIGLISIYSYFSEIIDTYLLITITLSLIVLCGVFMSNLAIEPLKKYLYNIQNLSKETLHELNLPISTIKTNIGMLKKNQENEKTLKRIERIEMASDMLQQRYNELDYMIKTQTLIDLNEEFFIDELVKQRIDFLSSIFPNIKFNLDLDSTAIISDKIGLGKVIDNIINNGVKYAPNSNKIDIVLKNQTLIVQDYGIGMNESEIVQVFDKYYQSDTDMQGFGIGLNLVKRFCDKQNIKLRIESIPKKTTKIILTFKDIDGIK